MGTAGTKRERKGRGLGDGGRRARVAVVLALAVVTGFACARMGGPGSETSAAPAAAGTTETARAALDSALVTQQLQQFQKSGSKYRIGVDDVLEIRVYEYDKMNAVPRVDENGNIMFSPLGEVRAAGLTERQLERLLEKQLADRDFLHDHPITVLVRERKATEVAIIGAVGKPGRFPLFGEKRLVDLLSEAGGLTDKAGSLAYVMRFASPEAFPSTEGMEAELLTTGPAAGLTRVPIDLDGLLLRGEQFWNIELMPDDLVSVPEAGWVHVTGPGVEKPGTYPLTRTPKTVRQMLDEAGGMQFVASRRIKLVRSDAGRDQTVPIDYNRLVRHDENNLPMQAGDRLVTRANAPKMVAYLFARAFTSLIRFGVYGSWNISQGGDGTGN